MRFCEISPTIGIICVYALSHSVVSDSLRPPWTIAHQTGLSMEFSRQEYWSGLPFPPPRDLPNIEIEFSSLESPPKFKTVVGFIGLLLVEYLKITKIFIMFIVKCL